MRPLSEFIKEYESEKEYSRADVKEILDTFQNYHNTMEKLIEYAERVFLMTGEMCGYDVSNLKGE
jgi:hypothetical protein